MLIVLRRRWLWGAGLVCCVVLGMAGILWAGHRVEDAPAFAAQGETMVTVIVDPGHGGVDGGASTADGVLEREGLCAALLPHATVLVSAPEDALDLLLHPDRLRATLRG